MKIFSASILAVILAFSAFGQNANNEKSICDSQTAEKISSRGIKLGMSEKETLDSFAENGKLTAVFPEYLQNEGRSNYTSSETEYQNVLDSLQKQARVYGFSSVLLAPRDKNKFDGIAHYDLGFLDNKLAYYRTFYTKPNWESRGQFIRKMSELLSLPVQENNIESIPYQIRCGDYKVEFRTENAAIGNYYTMSVSADINEIIVSRKKKIDDEQREKDIKTFRP